MGLGAYLATSTERNHYFAEQRRRRRQILDDPAAECQGVYSVLSMYGLDPHLVRPVVGKFIADEDIWTKVVEML